MFDTDEELIKRYHARISAVARYTARAFGRGYLQLIRTMDGGVFFKQYCEVSDRDTPMFATLRKLVAEYDPETSVPLLVIHAKSSGDMATRVCDLPLIGHPRDDRALLDSMSALNPETPREVPLFGSEDLALINRHRSAIEQLAMKGHRACGHGVVVIARGGFGLRWSSSCLKGFLHDDEESEIRFYASSDLPLSDDGKPQTLPAFDPSLNMAVEVLRSPEAVSMLYIVPIHKTET